MGSPRRTAARCGDLNRALAEIDNPVSLVRSYLYRRGLLNGSRGWVDELMDAGIEAVINGALAWDPDRYPSVKPYVYGYLDSQIPKALRRLADQQRQLGRETCISDPAAWQYTSGTDEYHRVELRVDLQRWADLAELTPLMRWIVEWAAHHKGTYVRDTPLAGAQTPLHDSGAGGGAATSYRTALKHMRQAAITNERRDDHWTRERARRRSVGLPPTRAEVLAEERVERLRAIEAQRQAQLLTTDTAPEGVNQQVAS